MVQKLATLVGYRHKRGHGFGSGDRRRAPGKRDEWQRPIAFLFILLGVWQMLSGNFGNGLWIAFIGWFLENAASAQIHQQTAHDLMADHQVAEAMSLSAY